MTDRNLTGNVTIETEEQDKILMAFVELSFSTPIYIWSGTGTLTATMPGESSQSWVGVGELGSIEPIVEASDGQTTGLAMPLSGIDNDLLSNALTDDYQGRSVKVWVAFMDETPAIVEDPLLMFAGQMDVMTIMEGDATGQIRLQCEARDEIFRRQTGSLLTDEEQNRLFPGDKGLEFVAELQNKEILWGTHSATPGRPPADLDTSGPSFTSGPPPWTNV